MVQVLPTNCPNCGALLIRKEDQIVCIHCGTLVALIDPPPEKEPEESPPLKPYLPPTPDESVPEIFDSPPNYIEKFDPGFEPWKIAAGSDVQIHPRDGKFFLAVDRVPTGYYGTHEGFVPSPALCFPSHWKGWGRSNQPLPDQMVQVETGFDQPPPDVYWGVVLAYRDIQNYMLVELAAAGQVRVEAIQNGSAAVLKDWVPCPEFDPEPGAVNVLFVNRTGHRLAVYLNGQLTVQTELAEILAGKTGLFAGKFQYTTPLPAEVWFDNLKVWLKESRGEAHE